jgi:OTU domain-containing protein 6
MSDEALRAETLDAIEARHADELAAVRAVTAGMTAKRDKTAVLKMEGAVTDRHYEEMRRWEQLAGVGSEEDDEGEEEEDPPANDDHDDPSAVGLERLRLSRPPPPADTPSGAHAPTKAMKRRAKKEAEERARLERVALDRATARSAGPSASEAESARLASKLGPAGLRVREIRADGHCMYRAVIDQLATRAPDKHAELELLSIDPTNDSDSSAASVSDDLASIGKIRAMCAEEMRRREEDYRPFLSEESDGALAGDWDAYLETVRSVQKAAWGGQLELRALARALKRPIEVFTADMPTVTMGGADEGGGGGGGSRAALKVCHQRHAFGLGEHYNAVADA